VSADPLGDHLIRGRAQALDELFAAVATLVNESLGMLDPDTDLKRLSFKLNPPVLEHFPGVPRRMTCGQDDGVAFDLTTASDDRAHLTLDTMMHHEVFHPCTP
jgi:hypothetical protein